MPTRKTAIDKATKLADDAQERSRARIQVFQFTDAECRGALFHLLETLDNETRAVITEALNEYVRSEMKR